MLRLKKQIRKSLVSLVWRECSLSGRLLMAMGFNIKYLCRVLHTVRGGHSYPVHSKAECNPFHLSASASSWQTTLGSLQSWPMLFSPLWPWVFSSLLWYSSRAQWGPCHPHWGPSSRSVTWLPGFVDLHKVAVSRHRRGIEGCNSINSFANYWPSPSNGLTSQSKPPNVAI